MHCDGQAASWKRETEKRVAVEVMSEEKAMSKRGKSLEDPKDVAFSPSSPHSSLTLGQPLLLEAP